MKQAPTKQGRAYLEAKAKVMSCSCSHEFQDRLYGKGKRVHNPFARGFRCTVCGAEKLS